jgi:hypothetical protein
MGSEEKVSKVGGLEDVIFTDESKLQIRPCQKPPVMYFLTASPIVIANSGVKTR